MRNLLWLACFAAGANGLTVRAAKRDAVGKAAEQKRATEMIQFNLATQTTRPAFEQGRRLDDCDVTPGTFTADDKTIHEAVELWFDDNCKAIETYGHISTWETGEVTNMVGLFKDKTSFNDDTGQWDTSRVTKMRRMFHRARRFNQPLGGWHVDQVVGMSDMFREASDFDQPIGDWRVDQVTDMSSMFREASAFNQPIGNWQVDKVTSMYEMFDSASSFNQSIGGWRVDKVTDMSEMFIDASSFNQPIGDWLVDEVTSMEEMFEDASAFDQDLGWCVANDLNLDRAFHNTQCASTLCGVLWGGCDIPSDGNVMANWKIRIAVAAWLSNATAAEAAYGHISTWETSGVTDMAYLFCVREEWMDGLDNWDTCVHLSSSASSFNDNISVWDTSSVTKMHGMFRGASSFNQALGWCVREDVSFENDFRGAFTGTECEALSCAVVQGVCPDPNMAASDYCKLSDPERCSGDRVSFVEAPSNPFANIENRYAVPIFAVDRDGINDLLVGREDGTVALYRQAESGYQHVVDDEDPFKSVAVSGHAAPALVDLDGDGDLDLVLGAEDGSLTHFRNDGSNFMLIEGPFSSISVDAHSAPAFADLDSDGLEDLVVGKKTAGALTYYKNVGSSKTAEFQVVSKGAFENVLVGSFSKPTFYDIDNDGDQDLVVGDALGNSRLFLNVGSRFDPSFSVVDDVFAGITPVYAAPTFGVLNEVPSLVIGSARGQLVVYGEAPKEVEFMATKFSPFGGIEVGSWSKPSFVDLDGDGLLDVVVGERSRHIHFYRNVGTPSQPNLKKVEALNPFDGIDRWNSDPTFADIDGDGDLDLVVGQSNGRLIYYRNVGNSSQPSFTNVGEQSPFERIDVGSYSKPTFVDLDADGDLDLVVGEEDGTLNYYRNEGTRSQPNFQKVDCVDNLSTTDARGDDCSRYWSINSWMCGFHDDDDFTASEQCCACGGGRLTGEMSPFDGIDVVSYSAPTFVDLDNDGDLDLVVGESDGVLNYYRNVGTPSQPTFEKVEAESPFADIDVGTNSVPNFADIDNDGDPDLIIGRGDGQLSYFQNAGTCQKSAEEGACSGNGACIAPRDSQDATCACLSTFFGSQCDGCVAGASGLNCQTCPGSTWSKPGVRQTCDECEVGFYRVGDDCVQCAPTMICDSNDVTLENFECEAGTYRDGNECKARKAGMICDAPGVTLENVRLENNRWRTSAQSSVIETCLLEKSCRASGNSTDVVDAGEALCRSGHQGPLCAVCKSNHYRSGLRCFKCGSGSQAFTIVMIFVGLVIFLVSIILSVHHADEKIVSEFTGGPFSCCIEKLAGCLGLGWIFKEAEDGKKKTEAVAAVWRNTTTVIKQVLGTWSVISSTPWILNVEFPSLYEKALDAISFLDFDLTMNAECVTTVHFLGRLLVATLAPICACLLICACGYAVYCFHGRDQEIGRTARMVCSQIVLLIIFLSYTTTSTTIFRAFRECKTLDERYHGSRHYMRDDYGTSCRGKRYEFIQAWAWIMFFVWPIGVPLVSFCYLWRHRGILNPSMDPSDSIATEAQRPSEGAHDSASNGVSLFGTCRALLGRSSAWLKYDAHQQRDNIAKIKARDEAIEVKAPSEDGLYARPWYDSPELFAFMYGNYEPEYWWFECFDYIRRLLLTGMLTVLDQGSAAQGLTGVLVALMGTQIYSWTRPFVDDMGDRVAEMAQWSTFFVYLAALMILVDDASDSRRQQKIFGALLVLITFLPPLIALYFAIVECGTEFKSDEKSDEAKDDGAAKPESSPTSPLSQDAPPRDEEQPVTPKLYRRRTLEFLM